MTQVTAKKEYIKDEQGNYIIPYVNPASTTEFGVVKVDGNSIISNDGVISSKTTRNIGEIVASTIPLTDAGLHLLDGALLQYGSYQAFIDYIADLYDSGDYDDIFETEANWQSSVTTYGVCGKFVYDSVNNTVRLPKYSNKIHTQDISSSAPVVGNGMTLGLTNGTANAGLGNYIGSTQIGAFISTASYGSNVGTSDSSWNSATSGVTYGVTTDPTKSGIIAQLSDITTSLDGYYYIVVATSTKTDIQVDIDEIVADLNGKADTDLTNVDDLGTSLGAGWAMPSATYEALTLGASGTTYTAPANGWFAISKEVSAFGELTLVLNNKFMSCFRADSAASMTGKIYIPACKNDTVTVVYSGTGNLDYFNFFYAVGSESEAS